MKRTKPAPKLTGEKRRKEAENRLQAYMNEFEELIADDERYICRRRPKRFDVALDKARAAVLRMMIGEE